MKKSILTFVAFFVAMLVMTGCSKNEVKDVRALVTSVDMSGDTLKSMKVKVNDDTLLFTLKDVTLNNGLMLHGDSVIINYIEGRNDSLRALVVTILPKASMYLDIDSAKNDTLITAPAMSEEDATE